MSNKIGYLTKVIKSGGQLAALFSEQDGSHYQLYLYLPEREKDDNIVFENRFAVYQNYVNHKTRVAISYKKPKEFTSTHIPKVEVTWIEEYKKSKEFASTRTLQVEDERIERLSEELRNNVVLSTQAKINASKLSLELEKVEDAEKEHLCILLKCSPKHANYCREDLGGKKNYYFSINYNKEEIKKFQASTKDNLFFQVTQYANSLNRKEQQDE